MKTLVRVELRKLATIRGPRVIVAAASALVIVFAVFAVATAGEGDAPPLGPETLPGFLRSPAQLLGFVALLIGVIAVAGEWTHRTVTRTFLLTPARRRVVMAKMLTGVIVGVGVSVLALTLGLLVVLPVLLANGTALSPVASAEAALATLGISALYGLMGVALGVLTRNQTVALVAALLWNLVAENVVPIVVRAPQLYGWLPGGAADAVIGRDRSGLLDPVGGGLLLAAYAVALATTGTLLILRRDTA
jgi:ABC-2 type transport system permease protein